MINPSVTIERAAVIPGEDVFLSQLVDNFSDEACKLVYADWLEEHGDAVRAAALRQYNAAFQSMNPNDFPDVEQLPRSWGRVIGLALLAEIARQGVSQFRDPLLALARPALTINAERFDHLFPEHNPPDRDPTTPIGSSKIFGLPDLPSGSAWPREKDCNCNFAGGSGIDPETACSFVAQFNFADFVGTQAYRGMPQSGLLSIFSCAEFEEIGMTDCYLTYHSDLTNLVRLSAPAELADDEANTLLGSLGWSVEETLDIPQPDEESPFPLLARGYRDPLHDIFCTLRRTAGNRIHTLLGYTYPTTGRDPLPGAEWISLACLENTVQQRFHFAIKANELRQGNFSSARAVWFDFD